MSIGFPQPRVRRSPSASVGLEVRSSRWGQAVVTAAVVVLGLAAGCGGGAQTRKPDGGPAPGIDGPTTTRDGGGTDVAHGETGAIAIGQPCTTGTMCGSGFCSVDGVCCQTACDGACLTCAAPGSVGTCIPAEIGTNPRGGCTDMGAASCGTDGFCDGTGSCENYAAGVVCQQAGCTGSTLSFAGRCDGTGAACQAAVSQSCAPWTCATTGACKTTCSVDADCTSGNFCVSGSCGLKPPGASCGLGTDCKSGICAQGACCLTACTGNCKSCGLTGSAGSCTNVPSGQDPLGQCSDSGATTCKTNGFCDGVGACQNYASGTVCGTDSCTGGTETVAGKCDGAGTCAPGTLLACGAYVCGATGDCKTSCASNADCAPSYVCNGTICGKKVMGVACTAATECGSGYCEQGVCCNTGCEATCQSCSLPGTVGTCTSVPAGADPLAQCTDVGGTNPCGTNGFCDGAGKCQFYPNGTVCAAQTCVGSTLSSASRCNGAGSCVAGGTQSCAPYNCGAGVCLLTCGGNTDCVSPNVCTAKSCGKYPVGAACAANTDCSSNFCAQGYCCNTACTGSCQSCALTNSLGTCTNVPAGQDPLAQCTDAGAPSCKNNGSCDGSGKCQNYAAGTQCAAATCIGSSFTPPAVCNGSGTCSPATPSSCGAYACNTTSTPAVCKTTCTVAADCTSPNICNGGTCTLQPLGTACTGTAQCASGLCQQGVCCSSTCSGTCASCNLMGTAGTCTNVPVNTDPLNACTDGTAAKCGNDGACDGSGKCHLYAAGTICAPATCASTIFTPAQTCDGAGNCQAVTTTPCTPFACDTTKNLCKTTCATTTDCTAPNTCNTSTMSCGLLSTGAACTANAACLTGFCAQGVCCNSACTALCNSCNVTTPNHVGTCVDVPAGVADPSARCTNAGTASCGTNGFCDGNGACQKYAGGTQCVAQTCTTSTLHPQSTCNGTGTCVTPTTSSCTPFICGTNACKATCASNADCISAAYMCSGGSCIQAVNLTVKTHTLNAANAQFIYFDIQIINNGTSAVPLSQLTVKYWYTYDTTPIVAQNPSCTYGLGVTCANTTISTGADFVAVSPARTNADTYFTFGFTTAAGNLAVGATAELGPGINKNDFSKFTQTNDYSYNSSTTFTTNTKVTVYLGGALVYGTEPM